MKIRFFRIALVLALIATPAAAFPPAQTASVSSPTLRYQVSVIKEESKFSVTLDFPIEQGHEAQITALSHLGDAEIIYPPGYFRIIEATGPGEEKLEIVPVEGGWEVRVAGYLGNIHIRYEIDMEILKQSIANEWIKVDPGISPYLPRLSGDYFFIPGFFLLLYPRNQLENFLFDISFSLPPSWRLTLPWGEGAVPGISALANGFFGGNLSILETGGDPRLTVAQTGNSDQVNLNSQEEFSAIMRRVIDEAREAWGNIIPGESRLLIALATTEDRAAHDRHSFFPRQPLLNSVFLTICKGENILSEDFIKEAIGELLRAQLGRLKYNPQALWLREGAIQYYRSLLPFRAGLLGASAFWDQISEINFQYIQANGSTQRTMAECGNLSSGLEEEAQLLSQGGAIALASLDSLISERGKGVDDLFRYLTQRQEEEIGATITNRAVEEALEEIAGVDYRWFFDQYIQGKNNIPPSYFSQLRITGETGEEEAKASPGPPKSRFNLVIFILALLLVFALPFLLEPYALRPRASAVPVAEDEEEEEEEEEDG